MTPLSDTSSYLLTDLTHQENPSDLFVTIRIVISLTFPIPTAAFAFACCFLWGFFFLRQR